MAPDSQTRFVWIADLLPDEAAAPTAQAMRLGLAAIKETLEGGLTAERPTTFGTGTGLHWIPRFEPALPVVHQLLENTN